MQNLPVLNFQEFIAAEGEVLTTTSQQVAVVFEKRHDHVLRSVRSLIEQLPEQFSAPNFGPSFLWLQRAKVGCRTPLHVALSLHER